MAFFVLPLSHGTNLAAISSAQTNTTGIGPANCRPAVSLAPGSTWSFGRLFVSPLDPHAARRTVNTVLVSCSAFLSILVSQSACVVS